VDKVCVDNLYRLDKIIGMSKKIETFYKEQLMDMRDILVEHLFIDRGLSMTDIAVIFRISKQRVSSIISKLIKNKDDKKEQ